MPLLTESVLVLNKYYLAVQVTVVKDSIIALVTGKAQVVDDDYVVYNLNQWREYSESLNGEDQETLDKYAGMLRSPSTSLLAPQVIRFPDCEYTSPLIKTVKYSRRNIYNRDKYTCQYCHNTRPEFKKAIKGGVPKKSLLNLDHVIPRSRGGPSSWTNIVTSCKWCNADKGDKLLDELGWKLPKTPAKPKWQSHVGTPFQMAKKEYWQRFLGR